MLCKRNLRNDSILVQSHTVKKKYIITLPRFKVIFGLFCMIQLLIHQGVNSQNLVHFRYFQEAVTSEFLYSPETLKADSVQLQEFIQSRLFRLYEKGFLAASYKMYDVSDSTVNVDFIAGQVYQTANISKGNMPEDVFTKSGFRPGDFQGKPFSYPKIASLMESALTYAENHGYPFASIKLDSINIDGNEIKASFYYQSGQQVVFDSLEVEGSTKIRSKYLMAYLGLNRGKPYEEGLIKSIPKRIRLLPYIRLTSDPEVSINNGKCVVRLFLEDQKVNSVDAIIGLLPNGQTNNKMLITGQVDLDLQNLFSSGKQIIFQWQRFNVESQMLKTAYNHPNLFRTPVNFRMMLDLFKQDTTFLNRSFEIELSLLSQKNSFIGFHTKIYNSSLISTVGLDSPETIEENADNKVTTYGLKYRLTRFDDPIFPMTGWGCEAFFSAGQKKIVQNPALDDEYYENITLNSIQYTVEGNLEKYWKLQKNFLLKSRVSAGYIHAGQLFDSDKYRLGGLSSIRGFAERSIFVTGYGIINLETRVMLGKESYIMAFFDQAFVDDSTTDNTQEYLYGTGAGISMKTEAGIFNFVLAMGKSDIQPFGFNYSKIHFGYISRF